ncbi:MAG: hypothetical protein S0880_00600 [Actinomycetota bacterium]|nr:hypothetical protein [Actinomycetota bacterium]
MDVPDAVSSAEVDPRLVAEIDQVELESLLGDLRRIESRVTLLVVFGTLWVACLLHLA